MKLGVAALLLGYAFVSAPAMSMESACGQLVHLTVSPADKGSDVAATLRRRLAHAGEANPQVEAEGDAGLRALLPNSVPDAVLTRPAKIEFRLVAPAADSPGAIALPKLDKSGFESVEPAVIINETHLREMSVRAGPDGSAVLKFRFDPHAIKNLLTASADAVGRKLAILVDDKIVADPIIQAPIASETGEIDGGFTMESGNQLADLMQNGRLQATVTVASREAAPCETH